MKPDFKPTLEMKREIVRQFLLGAPIYQISQWVDSQVRHYTLVTALEPVLRDFMNGKFTLRTAGKEPR